MASERPELTRRTRVVLSAAVWIVLLPLLVGFFLWAWWFGLLMSALAVYTTYDYVRSGGMAGEIDRLGRVAGGTFVDGVSRSVGRSDEHD